MTENQFRTEQEEFWAGDFGDEYITRNRSQELLASNINFFSRALRGTHAVKNCIEIGANVGMNLRAINTIRPGIELHGLEINTEAAKTLRTVIPPNNVLNESVLHFEPRQTWDVVLTKGVLVHIAPGELTTVYDKIVKSSGKYILLAEYYNPSPVTIPYRGHENRLFKRDFAGEILDTYPEFKLADYGFTYHRDLNCPQDDITWFLLERL
jgi:spore coat polysaccharide biosynthesis protein SpsF